VAGNDIESGTLRLGPALERAFIGGIRDVMPAAGDALPVVIDSNGQLGTAASVGGDITGVAAGTGLTGGGTTGDVSLAVDTGVIQSRVTTECDRGYAMSRINQNGTASCEPLGGPGDITSIAAGAGLDGGGFFGDVGLSVAFGGTGAATTVARSDHNHSINTTNTSVGLNALQAGITGYGNAAVGTSALLSLDTGIRNTAMGNGALVSVASGTSNTVVGYAAGGWLTGNGNTLMGDGALSSGTSASYNIAIGFGAGSILTTGSQNIYIGSLADTDTESNTLRLGRVIARAFIGGIRGITTGQNNAVPVVIDANGQLGTVSSSRRTKDNIQDLGPVSRGIFDLRPVKFTYKQPFADGSTPVQYGLIAEEVEQAMPALVAYGADGTPETVKYHVLPTLLLAEVQRLEREREALATEVKELRERLEALVRRFGQ
jgi:hypothetical protein